MAAPPPATTRGFLFADLRDYTRFVETHGDDAAAGLLNAYRALVRGVVEQFGGAEIRTEGDSFYIVFPSASSAVSCGLAILAAAAEAADLQPSRPIRVAIGVHAGETADDVEGPIGSAVNIAARVCAKARAGELLVTETVRSLTRTRLSVRFISRGSPRLKGIAEPIPLFAVVSMDAAAEGAATTGAPGPRARLTRTRRGRVELLGVGLVGIAVIALAGWAALARGGPAPSQAPNASGSPNASVSSRASVSSIACSVASFGAGASLPPVADVPFYRATAERTSLYPGPGPVCQPTLVWDQQLGPVAAFVPIVVDGLVVVGDQAGLHAFDATSGKPAWTLAGNKGFLESAAAADHVVYAADAGGTLYAVDSSSGHIRWKRPIPNTGGIHPLVADGLLWVGTSDANVYGLDPASGSERWHWDGPSGVQLNVAFVTDETAYVTAGGAPASLYAIRLVGTTEIWRRDLGPNGLTGPVLDGDTIYVGIRPAEGVGGDGALYALDRATGKNRWTPPFAIASGKQVTPGPVRHGVLWVQADGDGVYALQDRGSTFEVAWHNPDVGFSGRPASLVADTLYVQQAEDVLVALRADGGQKRWSTAAGYPADQSPVVTGGFVYQVDSESNIIRAWAEPGLKVALGVPTTPPSAKASERAVVDPFEVVATFPWFQAGIQQPAAMALGPDGLLYVLHAKADYSNPQLTVVDPMSGQAVRSWGRFGSGRGEFDFTATNGNEPGGCIAIASNGDVYIGERGNQRVEVFKPDGALIRQIGVGQLGSVLFCALGRDGSLYTIDDNTGRLSKFGPSGKLQWQMLVDPQRPGTAFQLHGIAVRNDGKLIGFVDSTGQVLLMDPRDGHVISKWGEPGSEPGQLGLSGEPTLDAAGNIYVFQYVPQAVQVFDPEGHFIGGTYEDPGLPTQGQWGGRVFWPPPVFTKDGFGYTFGPDGLERLKVTLPGR